MSTKISHKEFNEVMFQVTSYLSWETDTKKIESAIRLWSSFQKEVEGPALGSRAKEAKALLLGVITDFAS